MIDKSIPLYDVWMYKTDTENFPKHQLPDGFTFSFYNDGDEKGWARLECEVGQFANEEEGIYWFNREFVNGQTLSPKDRMLFVKDENGEIVATASLWNGKFFGSEIHRLHWLAVSSKCAGRGIAKAMLTRLLELYNELGYSGYLGLHTGTRYYTAVRIYKKFGFKVYDGDASPFSYKSNEDFVKENAITLALLKEKIGE